MPKGLKGEIVPALMGLIRRKGELLYLHSLMVSELAQSSAQAIGMSDAEVDVVAKAGLLHDLGKIAIRTDVLFKPDRLSGREWQQMKLHPQSAANALGRMPNMARVANIILHHHESGDGQGYPFNLKNEHIPIESKIIRICDVFSAMVTEMPYRPKFPFEYAAKAALDSIALRQDLKAHIFNVFEAYEVDKEGALIHVAGTFKREGGKQ